MTDRPIVGAVPDFAHFYRDEFRSVAGLAFVLSGNAESAEDLAQEAFAAAFRRWDEVGRMDRPGAWVRRVVANRSVSRFRRLGSEARALTRMTGRREPGIGISDDTLDVLDAIRRLAPRQAQVVALHYFADLPLREVASAMSISEETVRTHLQRARSRLGRLLGETP